MDSIEEISGEKLLQLFDRLQKEKTILRLHLLGKEYERLTIINGWERKKGKIYLVIDGPDDLDKQVLEGEGDGLFFDFIDKKKIYYSFETDLKEIAGPHTLIHLPLVVNRLQRRQYFRITAPIGSRLVFKIGEKAFEFGVINLSQNGLLIHQTWKNHTGKDFFKGLILKNLKLVCRPKQGEKHFSIQQAVIRRIEKNLERGQFFYGLHFLEIDKKEQESLRSFIYECQRDELKKNESGYAH